MARVIVVGSANRDTVLHVAQLPRPGETVASAHTAYLGGGKGANQAVAAARSGANVVFLGAVGDDEAGRELLAELAGENIDTSRVHVIADVPTGAAFVVVDRAGENQIVIDAGANSWVRGDFVTPALSDLSIGAGDVLLTGFEVPEDAVLATLSLGAATGATLVLNPSPVRSLRDRIWECGPILVANQHEAHQISFQPDYRAAVTALADRTGSDVVVTLGSQGALAHVDGTLQHFDAPQVDVVDSTGAGDSFCGTFAAAIARGDSGSSAVRAAVTAAAESVRFHGARGRARMAKEGDDTQQAGD